MAKVRNTLSDLNNILFEALERIKDPDLTGEELEKEMERAQAVTKVGETIIRNGELALKVVQTKNEYGYGMDRGKPAEIPEFIGREHEN